MRPTLSSLLKRSGVRIASITPRRKTGQKGERDPGETPHDLLWRAVSAHYVSARREYAAAVPERRFRIDIAITARRVAIEVDGWAFHGRHKGDFVRDRERQNLLVLQGWRVLRFTAGQVRKDLDGVLETIRSACANGRNRQQRKG